VFPVPVQLMPMMLLKLLQQERLAKQERAEQKESIEMLLLIATQSVPMRL
jgi:hypothetical protein